MTHQEMVIKIKELEKRIKELEQESKIEKVIKMCNVTSEEREIINKNIKSISKPTGVNLCDLYKDPCEDTISRQAVLKQLKGCLTGGNTEYNYVKMHIDNIPPVNLQPKTGRLIDDKCSVCGKGIEDLISSPEWYYRGVYPHFCPFCGIEFINSQGCEEG